MPTVTIPCKSKGCTQQAETHDGYCKDCANEIEWLNSLDFEPLIIRNTLWMVLLIIVLAILIGMGVKECRPVGEPAVVSSLSQVREITR